MTSDPFPSPSRTPTVSRGEAVLDGEVIPPPRAARPDASAEAAPMPQPRPDRHRLRHALIMVGGVAIASAGISGGLETYRRLMRADVVAAASNANAAVLTKLGKDVGELKSAMTGDKQDETLKALRKNVEQLRGEIDALRSANAAATVQLSAKLEAKPAAAGPALTDVVSRLDRIDRDPRLGEITSRLDRIEHQIAAPMPTGSIPVAPGSMPVPPSKAAAPQSTVVQASAAPPTRAAKPVILNGWILRDVYSGIALVEGRSGSVREVVPGEVLPGAGEVQAIQRRGRGWVVVTNRGIIDTESW